MTDEGKPTPEEELLHLHYTSLNAAMTEVIGEEMEMPTFDIAGKANCGCVYHAEEGIACPHDLELTTNNKK